MAKSTLGPSVNIFDPSEARCSIFPEHPHNGLNLLFVGDDIAGHLFDASNPADEFIDLILLNTDKISQKYLLELLSRKELLYCCLTGSDAVADLVSQGLEAFPGRTMG